MVFLPLYRTVAQDLSEGGLPDFFAAATVPQLAAVLCIQSAPKLADGQAAQASIERQLAQMISAGQQANTLAPLAFQNLVYERFSASQFAAGLSYLAKIKVSLLDDEHPVEESRYLDSEGQWLYTFSAEYQAEIKPLQPVYFAEYQAELSVTDPQNRMLREFLAAPDESFNVQGYAGSGKTHLISRFAQLLTPERTLLLAQTYGQLQALKIRAGQHFPAMTFAQAAGQVLDSNLLANSWRLKDKTRMQQTWQVSHTQVAQWLNIPAIAHLSPAEVASVCARSVASYCNTTAQELDFIHFPIAIAGHLSVVDKAVLL
ncbi:MAG TPA: hypothetical protein VFD09_12755, partial [Thiopseudomonas sp.]|nr:hypothetical protein [Thiopseudomonas sp.]